MSIQDDVISNVLDERHQQDKKWGDQTGHNPFVWLAILHEESGEAAKAALEGKWSEYRKELVQVAAVAVAAVEAYDTTKSRAVNLADSGPVSDNDAEYKARLGDINGMLGCR